MLVWGLAIGSVILYGMICWYIIVHNSERRTGTTKTLSQKRVRFLRTNVSERETRRKLNQIIAIANLMRLIPWIGYNKEREEQNRLLLSAVDKRDSRGRLVLPEELYVKQLIYAGVVFGVCIVASAIFGPFVLLIAIPLAPLAMNMVTTDLKDEQTLISQAISNQFLDFYKVYYVQFVRRDVTNTLSNVAQSFIPRADELFKKVLSRFISDLDSGEEYALTQLDLRFPENGKIHKFVAIAKARQKGDEAVFDSMRAFLEEMEEQRDSFYDNELETRVRKIGTVVTTYLMLMFAVIMTVLLANMMAS